MAIFCNNAMVVLVLNKPTARRFKPCRRQASTAPIQPQRIPRFYSEKIISTGQCSNTTIFFVNTFLHHCFFHHLFNLDDIEQNSINQIQLINELLV